MWSSIPAIDSFQRELDGEFPNRTRPDWILGDDDHSSRVSDHNPAPDGDVHAIDIRLGGGLDPKAVLEAAIGDRRVKYVIFNYKIYSRTYGWEARAYTGKNPHTSHIHVSFRYEPRFENDTSRWFEPTKRRTRPMPIDLSIVRNQFLVALDLRDGRVEEKVHVKRLQRAYNLAYPDHKVEVDGIVGPKFLRAWGRHEGQEEGRGRPRVPDRESVSALLRILARYRMVL